MQLVIWCGFMLAFAQHEIVASDDVFKNQVAPLLSRKCLSCHNDELKEGGLSLSHADGLRESGYLDTADVDSSHLLHLVTPENGEAEMPKAAPPLSSIEIEHLRDWIKLGAPWPDGLTLTEEFERDLNWWSLKPITEPRELPSQEERNLHPVDHYVDARLRSRGLRPVGKADPTTLFRRLNYCLTGLPPTPAEAGAFVTAWEEDQQTAWLAEVDRLLESQRFGEKWAQHWLDLARYAETHGYDKDKPRRNAWPYRDYVIRSLNQDKPYTQFVREQIAGDSIYPGEADGILGLGFLAAGPWDFIGHWEVGEAKLDGRIAKHLDRDEMISAVFNVFMSTTVQCAQCHHHKFDPISTQDYYQLHAVIAAVDRADRIYAEPSPAVQQRKTQLATTIEDLERESSSIEARIANAAKEKTAEISARISNILNSYGNPNKPEPAYGYHSQIAKGESEVKWVQVDLGHSARFAKIRIMPAYDQFNGIGAGFGFPVRYRVEVSNDAEFVSGVRVLREESKRDLANPGTQPIAIDGDGEAFQYVRLTATKLRERKNDFILALGEIQVLDRRTSKNAALNATVTAKDSIESGVRWGTSNLVDGVYYREITSSSATSKLADLREQREQLLAKLVSKTDRKRLAFLATRIDELREEQRRLPKGRSVYAAATKFQTGGRFSPTLGEPRPIHLLQRGDVSAPGVRVSPGIIPLWKNAAENFPFEVSVEGAGKGWKWDERDARRQLAFYLTDRDNPLVWRSIVNRLWLWTFDSPLVATPNDFGRGGMEPTHPALLDYLAWRLREDPQHSLKSIIRLMVTSETFQRASDIDPQRASVDGTNQLLWRANRRRLTAEEFRDSLLFTAGRMNEAPGGPSFQDFVIEKPEHSPHYEYHLHDPADETSHRRSIYRFVVRSQPQPLLTTLDCADPSISTPQRGESTTALQALAAWNNRIVEFAAKELGAKIAGSAGSQSEQVSWACELVLARKPSSEESDILENYLKRHGPIALARVLYNMNAFIYLD